MNWRRGLLLAAINLISALPMILSLEARDARYLRELKASEIVDGRVVLAGFDSTTAWRLNHMQEGIVPVESLCSETNYPIQSQVVRSGNFPVSLVAGWRLDCRPSWTITGYFLGRVQTRKDFDFQGRLDFLLLILIAVQWIFIGGFPFTKSTCFWNEPGAWITAWTLVASALALISVTEWLAPFGCLLAAVGWGWWLILVVWKLSRLAWPEIAQEIKR